jgi:hypothetical protein
MHLLTKAGILKKVTLSQRNDDSCGSSKIDRDKEQKENGAA